jgi:hypothetical protein
MSRRSFQRLTAHWVLSLRSAAWIEAEILAGVATDDDRADRVKELEQRLLANQAKALEKPWVYGVPYLYLYGAAPMLLAANGLLWWSVGTGAAVVVAGGIAGWLAWRVFARYRETRGLIDRLGFAVHEALHGRTIEGPIKSRPGEQVAERAERWRPETTG